MHANRARPLAPEPDLFLSYFLPRFRRAACTSIAEKAADVKRIQAINKEFTGLGRTLLANRNLDRTRENLRQSPRCSRPALRVAWNAVGQTGWNFLVSRWMRAS